MTYTISKNSEFNSIEITFENKPSEAIRNALKKLRFRWHSIKKVWYGYSDENSVKNAIENAENGNISEKSKPKAKNTEKVNKYGVKVGDIFSASWGWEQTNVNFFQVIELVGECSVRVREVYLEMIDEKPTCGMAADRTYKLTKEILPPVSSNFINDEEKGDLKRIKPGYYKDPKTANENCFFILTDYANAYKCNGETVTEYESWYA